MTTYDFGDGKGPVPAHRHKNPDGSEGDWVADTAAVAATAHIGHAAKVCDNAVVYDNAQIYGNAQICDNARVYHNAQVYGTAQICGNALVYGNAQVYGTAQICGSARVHSDAIVYNTKISGVTQVSDSTWNAHPPTKNTQENKPLPTIYHQTNIINPLVDMATKYNKAAGKAFEKGDDTLANALRAEAVKLTTLIADIKTELPTPREGVR